MPSRHRCFLLTPTDDVVVTLRRYAFARDGVPPCGRRESRYPGAELTSYETHDVEIEVTRAAGTLEASLDGDRTQHTVALDDPRWPTACSCGYVFRPEDAKQESHTRLYQRGDNQELVTIGDAPVGALYDWRVLNGDDSYHRNGEMSLVCKTPAGEWMIDGPASNGPGWTRTGAPPDIDVTPSIGIGSPQRMHGWLRNGWLEIDMP